MRPFVALATIMTIVASSRARGPVQPAVPPRGSTVPVHGYAIEHTYPHDPKAFTQGLQYADGVLYEGTGQKGHSSIRRVKLETGEVLQKLDVPAEHFGEGITVWKSQLIELTWQSQIAFVYDKTTFELRRTFKYVGEGWGLTHDGTNLIMSDGSNQLRVLDPATFEERRRIRVVSGGGEPLRNLNELEYVKGEIFANIWTTDFVARIAPATGQVVGYIDLRGLLTETERASTDVLNGIAYDAQRDRLFVTGKWWPKLFEIRVTTKGR